MQATSLGQYLRMDVRDDVVVSQQLAVQSRKKTLSFMARLSEHPHPGFLVRFLYPSLDAVRYPSKAKNKSILPSEENRRRRSRPSQSAPRTGVISARDHRR
jgi:hypothetical protein